MKIDKYKVTLFNRNKEIIEVLDFHFINDLSAQFWAEARRETDEEVYDYLIQRFDEANDTWYSL